MFKVSVRDTDVDARTTGGEVAAGAGLLRPLLILAGAGGLLLAASAALWIRYGTAVFYEMIAAGIAACL
jgi:hypothetical protein